MKKLLLLLILIVVHFTCYAAKTDSYDVNIAVTINEDNQIMGILEYTDYSLTLVTFNPVLGKVHALPYVFKVLKKKIISKDVHQIKCECPNDVFGGLVFGTIDFRDPVSPKIKLASETGHIYIKNITEEGKEIQMKYIPDVWLGQ